MIKKEDIKKWVSERSKTINACLDLADLNGEFDQMVSDIIHDCITELSLIEEVKTRQYGKEVYVTIEELERDLTSKKMELPNDK